MGGLAVGAAHDTGVAGREGGDAQDAARPAVQGGGASDRVAGIFRGRVLHTVVIASLVGAVTPVCGVTVLPLMAGLLASGVPLAPVMAFWLSSPVTDPAMLATTAATLGFGFAFGKSVAAFGLGLFGGLGIAVLSRVSWTHAPLRQNRIVGALGQQSQCGPCSFDAHVWRTHERRQAFWSETRAITRLILICLIPAFAAEYWLNEALHPEALTAYVGSDAWWAVPVAVLVGAPAYLDGYAGLPLARGLDDPGVAPGAALGFIVAGGAVSVCGWGGRVGVNVGGALARSGCLQWVGGCCPT